MLGPVRHLGGVDYYRPPEEPSSYIFYRYPGVAKSQYPIDVFQIGHIRTGINLIIDELVLSGYFDRLGAVQRNIQLEQQFPISGNVDILGKSVVIVVGRAGDREFEEFSGSAVRFNLA